MRSYFYDDHKLHSLFTNLINRLSQGGASSGLIFGLLKDICEHFHFGRGLVFEADHSGVMTLAADYAVYGYNGQPYHRFDLKDHLGRADLELLVQDTLFVVRPSEKADDAFDRLADFFGSNSLLLSAVADGHNRLIGLVVLLDRRRQVLLDAVSVSAARTVIKLLANYLKAVFIQHHLDYAHAALTSILDNMGVDLFVSDRQTREVLFVNKSMADRHGSRADILGRECCLAFSGTDGPDCEFCRQNQAGDEGGGNGSQKVSSWDYQSSVDGAWRRVFSADFTWVDGRPARVVTSVDISENKRKEELINRLAYFDHLTQLPNRGSFMDHFSQSLANLRDGGGEAWLLFFDLDNFKLVNDTMGHQAGDKLLTQIGRFMESDPELAGHFYRYGGDEFVLYYESVDRRFILEILGRVLARFRQPWDLGEGSPLCGASIGAAHFPDDGQDMDALLKAADQALYKAKNSGKGQACFTDGECFRGFGGEK